MALNKYRFIFDGVIINRPPQEWRDIELALERDEGLAITVIRFSSTLTFVSDGFEYLKNRIAQNYNDSVGVVIERLRDQENEYETQFTGVILLSDVVLNLDKREAKTAIEDNSFFSIINNRKTAKAILTGGFSINQTQLTPLVPVIMDFFKTAPAAFNVLNRNVYLVTDVLDYLVRYMTDDQVKGIVSTYLTTASNFNDGLLYIITGKEMRLQNQDAPDVSFDQIFRDLKNIHNIGLSFETDVNGDPVMRIEEQEYFFEQSEALTIRNIKDLEQLTDKKRLFSTIDIGNQTFTTGKYPTDVRYFVFRDEQYVLQGRSAFDRTLDLTTEIITDTNVFIDIVENNNDEYDDDVLLLEGEVSGIRALRYGSGPNHYYNDGMTNDKIIQRYLNGIPNSIAKYLTADSTTCEVTLPGDVVLMSVPLNAPQQYSPLAQTTPALFVNETFDTGANYVNTPDVNNNFSYYLIPFDDDYSFEVKVPFKITFNYSSNTDPAVKPLQALIDIKLVLARVDNGFLNILESVDSPITTFLMDKDDVLKTIIGAPIGTDTIILSHSHTFASLLGEKITYALVVDIDNADGIDSINIQALGSSTYKCLGSQDDGGVYQVINPEDYRARLYKFQKNVSLGDIGGVIRNPFRKIRINEGSDTASDKTAWGKRITYKLETSEATFELID